ncbi:MAG: hypothetical protein NUK57_02550 [Gudongella sp.]|nr:hypothetical protein [Gudongella sp.]
MDLDEIPRGIVRDDDLLEIFLTEFDIEMSEGDVESVVDGYGLSRYLPGENGVEDEIVIITFSEQNPFVYEDNLGDLNLPYSMIILFPETEGEAYLMDMAYEELHHYEYVGSFEDIFDEVYIQDAFQELRDGILDYNTEGLRVLEDASETEGVIAFTYEEGVEAEADLLLVLMPAEEGEFVVFVVIHPQSMGIPT